MLKSIKCLVVSAFVAVTFLFAASAQAQVPANTVGIDCSFASDWDGAGIFYTLSNNVQVGLNLIMTNTSYTVPDGAPSRDSETAFGVDVYCAYYLSQGDAVSPYLIFEVDYLAHPKQTSGSLETTRNDIGIEFGFGGQAFVVKGLALWGQIGIEYNMQSTTTKVGSSESTSGTNVLNLFTTAVGASFYF